MIIKHTQFYAIILFPFFKKGFIVHICNLFSCYLFLTDLLLTLTGKKDLLCNPIIDIGFTLIMNHNPDGLIGFSNYVTQNSTGK